MHFRNTSSGALAVLSPDEARLIDLVIRLHDQLYGRDPERSILDVERGDMITFALLHCAEAESQRLEPGHSARPRGAAAWPAAAAASTSAMT